MNMRAFLAAVAFIALLPSGVTWAQDLTDEQEFQAIAAVLKENDAERQSAIDACITQGAGFELAGLAKLMDVRAEISVRAWCMRSTNGIAEGKITFADMQGINEGKISANAAAVLKTPTQGE